MEAPLYPPAERFVPPVRIPEPMSTRTSSFQDFLDDPQAKAIMLSEVPNFEMMIGNPQLKPNLGNMCPRDLVQFGVFKADALDRVDARLKAANAMSGGGQ
jgi:hypothetical protein